MLLESNRAAYNMIMHAPVTGSVYNLFKQNNLTTEESRSILAMDCLGCEPMTYGEMDQLLHSIGVSLNTLCPNEDVITHCGLTTIDSVSPFWAANMTGRKVNYVFPEFIAMDPVGYVEKTGTKSLIVLDIFYPRIAEALKRIKLDRVIISSLSDYASPVIDDSLPAMLKAMLRDNLFNKIKRGLPMGTHYELLSWNEFVGASKGKRLSEADSSKVAPDDVAGIFYTGGSTNRPKGIQLTNKGMLEMYNTCLYHDDDFAVEPRDRVMTHVPMPHATAAMHTVIEYMLRQCTLAMQPIFDVEHLLDNVRLTKPNHVFGTVTQHSLLAERKDIQKGEMSDVKRVFVGAEKLYEDDAIRITDAYQYAGVECPPINAYGMSELGTMAMLGAGDSLHWVRPIHRIKHRLIDTKGREVVGDGFGRLQIGTPAFMLGYQNNPEATAAFFLEDGWCDTGDLAERRLVGHEQFYNVFGRDDDLVAFSTTDDKRVHGAMIDGFVLKHPDVIASQTVVITIDGQRVFSTHLALSTEAFANQEAILRDLSCGCNEAFGDIAPSRFTAHNGALPLNATTHKRDIPGMAQGIYDNNRDSVH